MPETVAFIHTSPSMIPVFKPLAAELLPGVESFNIVDETLLRDIIRTYNVQGWAESFLSAAVIADPRFEREGGSSPGEEPGLPLIASAASPDHRIA